MTAAGYISHLLSREEYSFSFDELVQNSSKSKEALKSELRRLADKNEIVNLRKGFYLILTPRYRSFGHLPIELFIDKLFKYLQKSYYVACLTAAKFHGSAHEQIQEDYVITQLPSIRNIEKPVRLNFLTSLRWSTNNIEQKKSEAGHFNLASPALTAVDLIHYQSKLGGLDKQYTVIEELSEEITIPDLQNLLEWYPGKSTLQRLGYILDQIQTNSKLTDLIYNELKQRGFYSVLLYPVKEQKAGSTGNRWKIDANVRLESDL